MAVILPQMHSSASLTALQIMREFILIIGYRQTVDHNVTGRFIRIIRCDFVCETDIDGVAALMLLIVERKDQIAIRSVKGKGQFAAAAYEMLVDALQPFFDGSFCNPYDLADGGIGGEGQ